MNKSEIIEEESRLSSSIIDLEKRLASKGIGYFPSEGFIEEKFHMYSPDQYFPSEKKKKLKDLIDSPGTGEFPNKEVSTNGTFFSIHGVYHGELGLRPIRRVRRHIRNKMLQYHNPPEEEYFFEEGFGKIFGLDKTLEIKDFSDLLEESDGPAGQESLPNKISHFYTRLKLGALIWAEGRMKRGIVNKIVNPILPVDYFLLTLRQAMMDTTSVGKIANHLEVMRLPEPLNLEFQYIQEAIMRSQSGLNQKERPPFILEEIIFTHSEIPKISERSLYVARELLRISREKNLKKVHYLCGAVHDSQIKFFLENPYYSFGYLDEYMKEKGLLKVKD